MFLWLFVLTFNIFATPCLFVSPVMLTYESLNLSSTEEGCQAYPGCHESTSLVSFPERELRDVMTCQLQDLRKCGTNISLAASLELALRLSMYKSVGVSDYWVNSEKNGTFKECALGGPVTLVSGSQNCLGERPWLCLCTWENQFTTWAMGDPHFRLVNGSVFTCNAEGENILLEFPRVRVKTTHVVNGTHLGTLINRITLEIDDVPVLENEASNLLPSTSFVEGGFQISLTQTELLVDNVLNVTWMIVEDSWFYLQVTTLEATGGLIVDGCDGAADRSLVPPQLPCIGLPQPFLGICNYDVYMQETWNFVRYTHDFMRWIHVPVPQAAIDSLNTPTTGPTPEPTPQPTSNAPTNSPTQTIVGYYADIIPQLHTGGYYASYQEVLDDCRSNFGDQSTPLMSSGAGGNQTSIIFLKPWLPVYQRTSETGPGCMHTTENMGICLQGPIAPNGYRFLVSSDVSGTLSASAIAVDRIPSGDGRFWCYFSVAFSSVNNCDFTCQSSADGQYCNYDQLYLTNFGHATATCDTYLPVLCIVPLFGQFITSSPTTSSPTYAPTATPTSSPTRSPSTSRPSRSPSSSPTTTAPSASPTRSPTTSPTHSPTTSQPTITPSITPTISPTLPLQGYYVDILNSGAQGGYYNGQADQNCTAMFGPNSVPILSTTTFDDSVPIFQVTTQVPTDCLYSSGNPSKCFRGPIANNISMVFLTTSDGPYLSAPLIETGRLVGSGQFWTGIEGTYNCLYGGVPWTSTFSAHLGIVGNYDQLYYSTNGATQTCDQLLPLLCLVPILGHLFSASPSVTPTLSPILTSAPTISPSLPHIGWYADLLNPSNPLTTGGLYGGVSNIQTICQAIHHPASIPFLSGVAFDELPIFQYRSSETAPNCMYATGDTTRCLRGPIATSIADLLSSGGTIIEPGRVSGTECWTGLNPEGSTGLQCTSGIAWASSSAGLNGTVGYHDRDYYGTGQTQPCSSLHPFLCLIPIYGSMVTTGPSAGPTRSPSRSPSGVPTGSPTQCIPGIVTCCFMGFAQIVKVYVNEVDVTAQVVGLLSSGSSNHTVTFTEPSETAVIGLKLNDNSALSQSMVELICVCTRLGSPWNFDSSPAGGGNWTSVHNVPISPSQDLMPAGWYSYYFTGNLNVTTAGTNTKRMAATVCGYGTNSMRLQAATGYNTGYYTVRRTIVQPYICGTNGPTTFSPTTSKPSRSPSRSPSTAPSTSSPSVSPTSSHPSKTPSRSPSSSSPSGTPTASQPSVTPSTNPSHAPSRAPTTSQPSLTPSLVPTTSSPSVTPSYSPSRSPTTSQPSATPSVTPSYSPSRSPSTSAPSTSPTTSQPSRAPSQSPTTSSPTSSPTLPLIGFYTDILTTGATGGAYSTYAGLVSACQGMFGALSKPLSAATGAGNQSAIIFSDPSLPIFQRTSQVGSGPGSCLYATGDTLVCFVGPIAQNGYRFIASVSSNPATNNLRQAVASDRLAGNGRFWCFMSGGFTSGANCVLSTSSSAGQTGQYCNYDLLYLSNSGAVTHTCDTSLPFLCMVPIYGHFITTGPTVSPTRSPSRSPTTATPSVTPSRTPTTAKPSRSPTRSPSQSPSRSPSTSNPTASPIRSYEWIGIQATTTPTAIGGVEYHVNYDANLLNGRNMGITASSVFAPSTSPTVYQTFTTPSAGIWSFDSQHGISTAKTLVTCYMVINSAGGSTTSPTPLYDQAGNANPFGGPFSPYDSVTTTYTYRDTRCSWVGYLPSGAKVKAVFYSGTVLTYNATRSNWVIARIAATTRGYQAFKVYEGWYSPPPTPSPSASYLKIWNPASLHPTSSPTVVSWTTPTPTPTYNSVAIISAAGIYAITMFAETGVVIRSSLIVGRCISLSNSDILLTNGVAWHYGTSNSFSWTGYISAPGEICMQGPQRSYVGVEPGARGALTVAELPSSTSYVTTSHTAYSTVTSCSMNPFASSGCAFLNITWNNAPTIMFGFSASNFRDDNSFTVPEDGIYQISFSVYISTPCYLVCALNPNGFDIDEDTSGTDKKMLAKSSTQLDNNIRVTQPLKVSDIVRCFAVTNGATTLSKSSLSLVKLTSTQTSSAPTKAPTSAPTAAG